MAGWHLSEQGRHALRTARALARERHHIALGPAHLLAAILGQWDDQHAAGPALLRACGLTAERATALVPTLAGAYDPAEGGGEASPRPPDPAEGEAKASSRPPDRAEGEAEASPRLWDPAGGPRPSPALRLVVAHAQRVAAEGRSSRWRP